MSLNELTVATAMEQTQRAAQIEAATSRVEDLKKALVAQKEKKKELDDLVLKFKAASDSCQAFRQAQEEHNTKMAERMIKREAMLEALARMKEQLAATTEQRNASIDRLARARMAKDASNELKAASDRLEQTIILPGKEKMKRLVEKKETLAVKITEFHRRLEDDRAKDKATLQTTEERKTTLKAQVDRLKTELQSKEEEHATLERAQDDFKEKNRERIASHIAQQKIYEESSKYTEKEFEQRRDEHRAQMETDLQDFLSKSEMVCSEKEKLNNILEKGMEMIQTTMDVENA
jgi:chromosome segregation ATPase